MHKDDARKISEVFHRFLSCFHRLSSIFMVFDAFSSRFRLDRGHFGAADLSRLRLLGPGGGSGAPRQHDALRARGFR